MQITIDLPDEILAELETEAKQRKVSIDSLVEDLKSLVIEQFFETLRKEAGGDLETIVQADSPQEMLDTEAIINDAAREMKENQIKNRELAVTVITQKNHLHAEVAKQERVVSDLERKANTALKAGHEKLARMFFEERVRTEQILHQMRQSLLTAIDMAERVKAAIAREEERLRRRVTEALAARTSYRQTETLVKIYEAGELLRVDVAEGNSQEDLDRAFADWVETQRTSQATGDDAELSMKLEIQQLRARMEKLEHDWLRYDIAQRQKSEEAAT